MFGFFRRKQFTEPKAPVIPPPQYQAAPGTEIRFQPELVPQLKADHQNLIRWSIQEIRRIASKLAQRRIQPAHIIAWSCWRRAHQANARQTHIKSKMQL